MERWQSGLLHWFRKSAKALQNVFQGFKSLSFLWSGKPIGDGTRLESERTLKSLAGSTPVPTVGKVAEFGNGTGLLIRGQR